MPQRVGDLDEQHLGLAERVAQHHLVLAEPGAQAVDQRREGVDREAGRREVGLRRPPLLVGRRDHAEVHERELPDPERVVDDHVHHRRRHEPGVELAQRRDLLFGRFGLARAGSGRRARRRRPAAAFRFGPPDGVQRPLTLVSCHDGQIGLTTEGSGTQPVPT